MGAFPEGTREHHVTQKVDAMVPIASPDVMGEVSARVVHAVIEAAEAKGIDSAPLLYGLPFTRCELREWTRRVRWDDYMEIFDRLDRTLEREQLLNVFRDYHKQYPELGALAGALVSPVRFARLYLSMAVAAVPHIQSKITFISDFEVHLRMEIPPPYRDGRVYFELSVVALEALTCYLGLPRTRVDAEVAPRSALFKIQLPASRTIASRLPGVGKDVADRALALIASLQGDLTMGTTVTNASSSSGDVDITARLNTATTRWLLTPREAEVLGLLVRGRSNKEIASDLGCSPRTVEIHAAHLLEKSRHRSRAELISAFWSQH